MSLPMPMPSPSVVRPKLHCGHGWRPLSSKAFRVVRFTAAAPRAASASDPPPSSGGSGAGFNPFKRSNKKQDEARRVLQDMFKDKPDLLAAYDGGGKGGGKGKGKGGGKGGSGDDGSGSGGFDWRETGRSWLAVIKGKTTGVFKVVAASLLFVAILSTGAMLPAAWKFGIILMRKFLRLGGAGARRGRVLPEQIVPESIDGADLGQTERSMIAKYGGDADEFVSDGEEGGEEGEQ